MTLVKEVSLQGPNEKCIWTSLRLIQHHTACHSLCGQVRQICKKDSNKTFLIQLQNKKRSSFSSKYARVSRLLLRLYMYYMYFSTNEEAWNPESLCTHKHTSAASSIRQGGWRPTASVPKLHTTLNSTALLCSWQRQMKQLSYLLTRGKARWWNNQRTNNTQRQRRKTNRGEGDEWEMRATNSLRARVRVGARQRMNTRGTENRGRTGEWE